MRSLHFYDLSNPSSRNKTLRFTQSLKEKIREDLFGDKARSERWADNLTAICKPIV
jgi:hypothetical protein